jgi:hypothetical protein
MRDFRFSTIRRHALSCRPRRMHSPTQTVCAYRCAPASFSPANKFSSNLASIGRAMFRCASSRRGWAAHALPQLHQPEITRDHFAYFLASSILGERPPSFFPGAIKKSFVLCSTLGSRVVYSAELCTFDNWKVISRKSTHGAGSNNNNVCRGMIRWSVINLDLNDPQSSAAANPHPCARDCFNSMYAVRLNENGKNHT